ncbi:hypothetical protein SBF1_370003 [Candidatus Desulfosporosinus infrequens]|uniref:Uncharacterized protein n=1 Tax=Candidatus Desulfosporosinus infrequens TaxID=2043169 RepID=A0A2U3L4E9_9FIRM|nr:hypothetical protein SBF1_370003 [Candidatus Desulfosporosinus infrequens]
MGLPQGVTSIGDCAFSNYLGLTSITFNSTTTIYDDEFTIPDTANDNSRCSHIK